jgi:3-oxoacyl-ACP reductase-like protein
VELSPRQRRAVFAAVVIALAALGYYLVVPAATHSRGSAQNAASTPASTPSAPAATTQAAAPTVQASAAAAGGPDIYAWLPFTQQNLAAAASVAVRFSVDYNTFTYTESAADYVGAMGDLVTGQLAGTLRAVYQTPGVAKLRTSQKQVSTGTAAIGSLRAFGPSSMTFIVTAGQRLATAHGASSGSTQYAVTVTGSGSSWQVSDIELESAGNS